MSNQDPDNKEDRAQAPAEERPEERKNKNEDPPKNQRVDHDDPVEEASDESFPASDPPASY